MTDPKQLPDPYEVLQVQPNALPEVVRAAYRALAWKYHPDMGAQPDRMVAINDAWHVLGHAGRRAAYDRTMSAPTKQPVTAPSYAPTPRSTDIDVTPPREHGLAPRHREPADGTGSVLDFGRYTGWTIGRLVVHDPDYLRWLARTPVGRRLTPEIDAALSGRDLQVQGLAPRAAAKPRSLFGGLAARAR
jgi:hypothetical protein